MKTRINKFAYFLTFFFLVFLVFSDWFKSGLLSARDWPFLFSETIKDFSFIPLIRSGVYFPLDFYFRTPAKILGSLGFSWPLIERLVWFWPFLILTVVSSWYLTKVIFGSKKYLLFAICYLLFGLNTYILMVVGGGQMGVAMAYSMAPLVIGRFIKNIGGRSKFGEKNVKYQMSNVKSSILTGLILAAQIMFDPRIAFVTIMAVIIYQLFNHGLRIANWRLGISLLIAGLLHSFWFLPAIFSGKAALPAGYGEKGWVNYLSVAKFSETLSLLHPNWPENIFGKTYLMRPEFLFLPILAFINLLFINELKSSRVRKNVLFFALLGILGAFLAKGTNPPFGGIYLWLFENIPGMRMFRDPTKFYLLVSLSYAVLIPYSVSNMYRWINSKFKIQNYFPSLFLLFTIYYLLFLIKPAILGKLEGTFRTKEIPKEYLILKDFLINQQEFFRTFWVPKHQRFGFFSNIHPAISSQNFVTDSICRSPFCDLKVEMPEKWGERCFSNDRCYVRELSYFLNPKTADVLGKMGVKYIIVPFDTEGEIFIAEHKYNPQQRQEVEEFLDTIPWFKKVALVNKIAIYELPEYKDLFFVEGSEVNELRGWRRINPTKYLLSLKIEQAPVNLVFSESYDELWKLKTEGEIISSQPYMGILNSFKIDKSGELEVLIDLVGQKYVYYGLMMSGLALITIVGFLITKS